MMEKLQLPDFGSEFRLQPTEWTRAVMSWDPGRKFSELMDEQWQLSSEDKILREVLKQDEQDELWEKYS